MDVETHAYGPKNCWKILAYGMSAVPRGSKGLQQLVTIPGHITTTHKTNEWHDNGST
jgi:hypothetical protein